MIRNSLSISNSSLLKTIKRIISAGLIATMLLATVNILNTIYVDDDAWNRIMWNSFYKQNNIDNVFIGSSHVYCDVNPYILDEINGMNNFNLSTPALGVSGSYYLLREADRKYDISSAYVELYYVHNSGKNDVSSPDQINRSFNTIPYMRPSINKYEYLIKTRESTKYIETLFSFIRYRAHLFDNSYIDNIYEKKRTETYQNYEYVNENDMGVEEYMAKGWFRSTRTIASSNAYLYKTQVNIKSDGAMTDDNCDYMQKIIDYCNKNDINLKFFISPIYETQILSSRDYDAYYQQVYNIAEQSGVELYDFNLCKSKYLDIMHQEYYRDDGHLNEVGAGMFTPFLWSVLEGTYEENKKYFCSTYHEKISLDEPELYGIYYEDSDEGKACTFASNTDTELEYSIMFISEEGDAVTIQEFSINKEFLIKNDIGGGVLHVEARVINGGDTKQAFDIKY